ncbi:MAG TPA: FG-GAP-like repeat-containing protein [Planctomycetota bacterium]|nr:FG-GAP-like repeat-containing protein [Planctomycetota bacterium]
MTDLALPRAPRPLGTKALVGLLAGAFAGSLAAPAGAQTVLHTFAGAAGDQLFANAVAGAGDVDADGFPDVLIGARGDDTVAQDAGATFVDSGRTGALLLSWLGEAEGDEFGWSVAEAGDVNGDGHDDVIVGAFRHDGVGANSGRAYVFSGADGATLFVLDGTGADDEFSVGVSGVGDIDGDGVPDVAVGAHHDDDNGLNSGSVRVVSGANASQIYLFLGDEAGDDLGHVLAGIGDINADGVPDIIAGLHDIPDPGQARIYSGADGAVLFNFVGSTGFDFYGHAVAGAGDVDGDGVPDVLIGAEQDDTSAHNAGRAWLRSGATGAVLLDWKGDSIDDALGADVCSAGDWDGDGVLDVLIAMPGDDPTGVGSGAARFVSGADGSVLLTWDGVSPGPRSGVVVDGLGDVNGDGRPDVIIGFSYDDQAAVDAGLAEVLSGALPTWAQAGGGLAGVDGIPALSGQGLLLAGTPGALHGHHAAPLQPAVLFISLVSTPVAFKGGQLAAFPPIAQIPLVTSASGDLLVPFAAWPTGIPAGLVLDFQIALHDTAAVKAVAISNLLAGTTK